ncbi:MAG: S9 family peptidase [Candidatus Aminicenantes bacterium]|nr:MAG: S9 family peptidase [Candidatus Aminicenantes bacterium]
MFKKSQRLFFRNFLSLLLGLALIFTIQSCKKAEIEVPAPPETNVVEVTDNLHGVDIVDPYQWLEDQESPDTRKWIDIQNEYTDSILGALAGRQELESLVSKFIKIDTISMPMETAGRYFFHKRSADQDLSIIYMREGPEGEDEVLIDPHPMSEDHTTSVNMMGASQDAKLLAYAVRKGGEDEIEVRFLDVDARKDIPDVLPRSRYFGVSLTPDKSGFYYTRHEKVGPRIYYHAMGTDIKKDKLILGEGYGPEMILFADLSDDGRWLVITVLYGSAADKTEIYLKDLSAKKPVFPVVKEIPARFYGGIAGDTLYLQTNWEAPNQRILAVDPKNPDRKNWREVIPEGDSVIQGFSGAGGKLFVSYLKDVKGRVESFEPDGTRIGEISFPTIGTVSGVYGRWDSNEAFFIFTSFHISTTIYRFDVEKGEKEVWAQIDVPIESDKYEVKQLWYESKDGTKVPMFVVHVKDIKLDGNNPALLTGYGGFNISSTPYFSAQAAAWLERGGVYAVANLRGGGEFGEEWHKAGMRENKQNVFDDFIAAAEHLINEGYTKSEKLAIRGGSNGGLLVGAAMTQRPELFGAVVCTYPLLDMIRYHKFLVARYWVPEYGSSENSDEFKYLYAYSPYHQVKKGARYPAVLFITGDADTRVAPLHARKMTALVQASTGSGKPVLLRYHTKAGHSGGQPVSEQIANLTDTLSFLLWQLEGKF